MKVLHYNPHTDSMITQYVTMLADSMSEYTDVSVATSLAQFRKLSVSEHPDIVHLHGCWRSSIAVAAYIGKRHGARIVVSPHGQLEPWILHNRYLTYRLPRLIAYQRSVIADAYAVIAMGNMELRCIKRFTGNPRLEKVLNALITQKISVDEMARQIVGVYQKVLDSDTLELMDDDTRDALAVLIKAGITGNALYPDGSRMEVGINPENGIRWRQLLLYARHEDIMPVVMRGISATGVTSLPDIDVAAIPYYAPKHSKPPIMFTLPPTSDAAEQTMYLVKSIHKEASHNRLAISYLIQLHKLLFEQEADEDKLTEMLMDRGLDKFVSRLMYIMSDMTLLEEGYMVAPPINDRITKRLRKKIENRLKI